jgi:hypothetical protein
VLKETTRDHQLPISAVRDLEADEITMLMARASCGVVVMTVADDWPCMLIKSTGPGPLPLQWTVLVLEGTHYKLLVKKRPSDRRKASKAAAGYVWPTLGPDDVTALFKKVNAGRLHRNLPRIDETVVEQPNALLYEAGLVEEEAFSTGLRYWVCEDSNGPFRDPLGQTEEYVKEHPPWEEFDGSRFLTQWRNYARKKKRPRNNDDDVACEAQFKHA